jgi:hypothetical protein
LVSSRSLGWLEQAQYQIIILPMHDVFVFGNNHFMRNCSITLSWQSFRFTSNLYFTVPILYPTNFTQFLTKNRTASEQLLACSVTGPKPFDLQPSPPVPCVVVSVSSPLLE